VGRGQSLNDAGAEEAGEPVNETDTIVARSSGGGVAAVALLRLSGPQVRHILTRLGAAHVLEGAPRTATLCTLRGADGRRLDQGLVTFFEGPASYTGEDVAEIGVHGGPVGVAALLEACHAAGAREADPGEFTRRAYLAGKLDLVQVEAIDTLLHARSTLTHRAALEQLEGGLSRRVGSLRAGLLQLEAHLAHHVDFPEEDDAPVPVEALMAQAEALEGALSTLLSTAPGGVRMGEGATVVFAGPPNAGKSSLFNALLGIERAIVTDLPGTTRDAIEAVAVLRGFPFRLIDTAGIRASADVVEAQGIEVARRHLAGADVVLVCWAADAPVDEVALEALRAGVGGRVIQVRSCADRVSGSGSGVRSGPGSGLERGVEGWLPVSAHTGAGLDALQDALRDAVFAGVSEEASGDGTVVFRERQAQALAEGRDALGAFRAALRSGVPAEWAGVHLAAASSALERMIGVVEMDDVLDVVFRSFCVGK
jgi:tRNA modification GTPase